MRQKGRKRKFHSMTLQITTAFIGVLLFSMVVLMIINMLLLERYYVSQKVQVLLEATEALSRLDVEAILEEDGEEDGLSGQNVWSSALSGLSSRNNLSWVLTVNGKERFLHWGENERLLLGKLFGYMYDLDLDKGSSTILEEQDGYVVQQLYDRFSGMNYLECWGFLGKDEYFLIRTPLESIRESVTISNRFYFFVCLPIILLSSLLIWLVTRRITRPISELTELSRRMTGLEFDARYVSNVGNEIDLLGDHFNRMSEQLEQTISELKSANNRLQKDIADKIKIDEMRKEFLDNVSHELKTPIALIQGYAEGLKENVSEDPESREFYCDVIMDEAGKMNKLVKNLLTLNQLESGRDAAVMERFDLTALIRGVLQNMEIMIRTAQCTVLCDRETPQYVWADEFKTEQVLTNYISNAIHYADGAKQIEIRVQDQDGRARVSVFNTGRPIPEEDLPNLWEKFYKVDKARTREYGGNGIGLSIVKAIMESMNQEYGVCNYDNGVEFWFTLDRK